MNSQRKERRKGKPTCIRQKQEKSLQRRMAGKKEKRKRESKIKRKQTTVSGKLRKGETAKET